MDKSKIKNGAKYISYVAVISALLFALKFLLSFIPNIELVTVTVISFAIVMGKRIAVPAALVFCLLQLALYSVHTWVILYFLYYPTLALLSSIILKKPNTFKATVFAVIMTALFGVLSTLIDTLMALPYGVPLSSLPSLFAAYYIKGVYFYIVHIVSNALIVPALYPVLVRLIKRFYGKKTAEEIS